MVRFLLLFTASSLFFSEPVDFFLERLPQPVLIVDAWSFFSSTWAAVLVPFCRYTLFCVFVCAGLAYFFWSRVDLRFANA